MSVRIEFEAFLLLEIFAMVFLAVGEAGNLLYLIAQYGSVVRMLPDLYPLRCFGVGLFQRLVAGDCFAALAMTALNHVAAMKPELPFNTFNTMVSLLTPVSL